MTTLEKFTCEMYNTCSQTMTLGEARFELFQKRGITDDLLPPNKDAFEQHLQRSHYYATKMKSARKPFINVHPATDFGWNSNFEPIWNTKAAAPDTLINEISCGCKTGCSTNRCSCLKNEISCTNGLNCTNCANNVASEESEDDVEECDSDFD